MKTPFLPLCLALASFASLRAQATEYFVSGGANSLVTGTDDNATGRGTTATNPFRTIQFAAAKAQPGDFVTVRQGTYTNSGNNPVLNLVVDPLIANSGTAGNPITYRRYAADSQRPLIKFDSGKAIQITGPMAYITISGFRVQGNNGAFDTDGGEVTVNQTEVTTATGQPGSCQVNAGTPPAKYNGNGIQVDGSATAIPHDLRFTDNEIFECGGGGIAIKGADYVTIEQNLVYNNCWYTVYGTSGISILGSRNYGGTYAGYHMVIKRNKVFGNRLYVPWYDAPTATCKGLTDGNGIILDSNNGTGYTGRILIANNLVVNNGGAGVQVFKTNNASIFHNTFYQNSRTPVRNADRGEVFTNQTDNVRVQGNILVTDATTNVSGETGGSTGLFYTNNLFFGGRTTPAAGITVVKGTNPITQNPQFVSPSTNLTSANFALAISPTASPAINQGLALTQEFLTATAGIDLPGLSRQYGGSLPDLGAYETTTAARAALSTADATAAPILTSYPNPSTGKFTVQYTLATDGPVRLEVFDALGRRVAQLVSEQQPAGPHQADFDSQAYPAGLYHLLLTTPAGRTGLQVERAQ